METAVLKEMAADLVVAAASLYHCAVKHFGRRIDLIGRVGRAQIAEALTRACGCGVSIENRAFATMRQKRRCDLGGKPAINVGYNIRVMADCQSGERHRLQAQGASRPQAADRQVIGKGCAASAAAIKACGPGGLRGMVSGMKTLLSLGHGYSADVLAQRLLARGWRVIGTTRKAERAIEMQKAGIEPLSWPGDLGGALGRATHILASAAPDALGDPFLQAVPGIADVGAEWVGYLSTTGVYGDHQGAWVTEATPLAPSSTRGLHRVLAEEQWRATGLPVHVFRLAGIYGPGRGPFEKVRDGTARRIIKEGQVFSRIHVEDIASVLEASIARPNPGSAYNLCDDDPAPPEDVLSYAAHLLGLPEPPAIRFEDADLTPMARSFYSESKRVRNDRIKRELGVVLRYPSYRDGLTGLLADSDPSPKE